MEQISICLNDMVKVDYKKNVVLSNSKATKWTENVLTFYVDYSDFGIHIKWNFTFSENQIEEKGNFENESDNVLYYGESIIRQKVDEYSNQFNSQFKSFIKEKLNLLDMMKDWDLVDPDIKFL